MKRICILLCLLLLPGLAQAAVSVRLPETAAILAEDGTEIIPAGKYADAAVLTDDLLAVEVGGKYAPASLNGELLTDAKFDILKPAGDALFAKLGDKWGILNHRGEPLGYFRYNEITAAEDGFLALLTVVPDRPELCTIDRRGNAKRTGIYADALGHFSNGLAAVRVTDTELYGYCDAGGRLVIPAKYDYAGEFTANIAAVVLNGRYGAIDDAGIAVVPAEYDFLQVSPYGFILAEETMESVFVFTSTGNEIARYEGLDIGCSLLGSGYIVFSDKTRVYDGGGIEMLELSADASVYAGPDGRMIISEGAWGEACVRLSGTDARYQNIYPMGTADSRGIYAFLTVNTGRYMNDMLGEIQYSFDAESARYGILNDAGEALLDAVYKSVEFLCDDRLLVQTEDQWQMIDTSGRVYWQTDVKKRD